MRLLSAVPCVLVSLVLSGSLAQGLLVPASAADAATCDGRPATVTLTSGGDVYTAPAGGDAVVVVAAGSYEQIVTGSGDDAVCVLAGADVDGRIDTGGGDNFVSTVGIAADPRPSDQVDDKRLRDVVVVLGAGDDTFEGGAAWEVVASLGGEDTITTGDGADTVNSYADDTVSTGAGDDEVYVRGATGSVDLGEGDDDFFADDTSTVAVQGGAGTDRLHLDVVPDRTRSALVDLEAGFYGVRDRPANQVLGVENLTTSGLTSLRVRGSDEANDIVVQGCQAVIGAGDGADSVRVSLERCASKAKRVKPGFRSVTFAVRGGGGADRLEVDTRGRAVLNGGPGSDVVRGGSSDDVLKGGSGQDRIVGHGGFDVAQGGSGSDVCRAERRIGC